MAEHSHDPDLALTKPVERISTSSSRSFAHHATSPNSPIASSGTSPEGHHSPQPPIGICGKSRRKKHLHETDVLAMEIVFLCLVAAIVTASLRLIVAGRLGLGLDVAYVADLFDSSSSCV